MKSFPRIASFYILLVTALAVSVVLFSTFQIGNDVASWASVFILALGIVLLDLNPVMLFGEKIEITISTAIKFAAVLLFLPPVAILVTFAGTLLGEITSKHTWYGKLFNIAQLTIGIAASSLLFRAIYQSQTDYFGTVQNGLAVFVAVIIQFLMNWILVSLIVNLISKTPIITVWRQNIHNIAWYELSLYPFGVMLAILWQYNPISIILAGSMFLVIRQSYQVAVHLQRQTNDALRALMRVIDERDHHTFDHSERVSQNASRIAEALKLSPEEIEIIASAALLHDLGKVGMADDVLFNTNVLNPEEKKHARQHAEVGAMLLSKFPLFAKGADLVKYHHERYDGDGYPTGIAGNQIPMGARIISVADAYEAMIENRPYRQAFTKDEAVAQLTQGRGSQFDPIVVDTFIRLLRSNGYSH